MRVGDLAAKWMALYGMLWWLTAGILPNYRMVFIE